MFAPIKTSVPSVNLIFSSDLSSKADQVLHNPADFEVIIPNAPAISHVVKVIPLFVTFNHSFIQDTQPRTVLVALDGSGGGNTLHAKDGNLYEILLPMDTSTISDGKQCVWQAPTDLFIHEIDYQSTRDFSRFRIRLLDEDLKQLVLTPGSKVTIIMKLFHRESRR